MPSNDSPESETLRPLQLGDLSGAVLRWKRPDGTIEEVHFDE